MKSCFVTSLRANAVPHICFVNVYFTHKISQPFFLSLQEILHSSKNSSRQRNETHYLGQPRKMGLVRAARPRSQTARVLIITGPAYKTLLVSQNHDARDFNLWYQILFYFYFIFLFFEKKNNIGSGSI